MTALLHQAPPSSEVSAKDFSEGDWLKHVVDTVLAVLEIALDLV